MSSVASGETSSAAALGVAARTSATKSTIVTSVSWPIALTTGAREAATARARPSSLKHHRSSRDPPPRATMTTSTRSATNASARRKLAGASGPWTRAGAMMMCAIGYRRRRIVTISCTTAPTSEVTTPIFRGYAGSGRFRAASNRPSAASFLRVFWYAAQDAPTPAGVAALMRSCTEPRRGNTSTSPETTTSMPSSRSNPSISASSRKSVHDSWAVASFKVKNTWPEGARCRLLTSPRTRIRERIGFARIVSRMTRASCVTLRACGTPGRLSQVTAIESILPSPRTPMTGLSTDRGEIAESVSKVRPWTMTEFEGSVQEPPSRTDEFARAKERVEPHTDLRQEDRPSLFSVDDTHAVLDDRAVLAQPIDRTPQRAARRHDVFDEQHEIASVQVAFEVVPRAVFLRGLPNNDVRLVAREAHGGGDRDGAELDAGDPARPPRVRSDRLGNRPQEIRSGDGLLDIDVVRRGLAGREGEGPELERTACLQRGDEARTVEITMAPASGRFEIR